MTSVVAIKRLVDISPSQLLQTQVQRDVLLTDYTKKLFDLSILVR